MMEHELEKEPEELPATLDAKELLAQCGRTPEKGPPVPAQAVKRLTAQTLDLLRGALRSEQAAVRALAASWVSRTTEPHTETISLPDGCHISAEVRPIGGNMVCELTVFQGDDPETEMAKIILAQEKHRVNMKHRHVHPEWRRNGLGDALLENAEAFVQALANEKKTDVRCVADLGQADVLAWLYNRGYRGLQPTELQQVLARIRAGELTVDDELFLYPKDTAPEERTGRISPKNVRVRISKTFSPR